MPIYEYRCPDCGHKFDVIQKMSDDPVRVCPSCSAENVKKLISTTSFVLKGSGWYKDHYGLKSGGGEGASGASEATPAATPAKSEPAAAAPAAPATPAPSSSGSAGSS